MERSTKAGETTVRERIVEVATAEFLDRGFAEASLRHIAAEAGVTTGAIYGYFSSKSDLFDSIVRGPEAELYRRYLASQQAFYDLPASEQSFEKMAKSEDEIVRDLYDYILDNREAFLLLVTRSAGTGWEHFMDRYVDVECASTERYVHEMAAQGVRVRGLEPTISRTFAEAYFRCFFRPLELGLTREETQEFIASCAQFFHAGYQALMLPEA